MDGVHAETAAMLTLAIDTSAHMCAAALHDSAGDAILAELSDDIGRGHAERLMDVIAQVLADAGKTYADLDRVAACAGPGSFTGVRVGLATARGIALGLAVPAVGVSALAALAQAAHAGEGPLLVLLDARRGEAYAQLFGGSADGVSNEPFVADYAALAETVVAHPGISLCGSGAAVLAAEHGIGVPILHELAAAPIACHARLGAEADPATRPEPIYLRPPDAKPQAGFAVMWG